MNDTILARDLPAALDGRRDLAILSLDCFDTLLWRGTHAPTDVFRALHGISPQQRVWAEQRARGRAAVRTQRSEVGIADIYAELLPYGAASEHDAMVAGELAAEARYCFGFLPTIELMRAAQGHGLGIIVISDTYLNAEQLGALIAAAAGHDVRTMIDRIFCSSEYGVSKSDGLIGKVVKELGVRADTILHVGDNYGADLVAGQKAGVRALHFQQFTATTEQRIRLEAATSAMIHVGVEAANRNDQPHRAPIAIAEPFIEDPAELLGFTTVGPVLHGFAKWLAREAEALAKASDGGQVHTVFLMRDGYLPRLVFDATGQNAPSHATEISRFTATAASFTCAADVLRYVDPEVYTDRQSVLKQLLFEPQEIAAIIRQLPAKHDHNALIRIVRSEPRMRRVLERSRQFAERLCGYLHATIAPAAGDTLMLVDLGYNGSVQNQVEPVLRDMLKVAVAGRYLLLREQEVSGLDKAGFIGPEAYDADTLEALCSNVAVLEQLCTASQGSVINYTDDGQPVRAASAIKGRQSDIRNAVQRGVVDYARAADRAIVRPLPLADAVGERNAAVAVLARLMFLPMPQELAVLEQFQHDVNLGGDHTVALFDRAIAQRGMRRRGLFYMRGSERMYLPAELSGEGLAVKMTLMATKRFGLALKYADFIDQTISLPLLIADGRDVQISTITATPTHDGYFVAPIPIDDCRFSIGLQFGRLYEWLQVESVTYMPVDRFLSVRQRPGVEEVEAVPTLEGMEQTAPRLYRCEDNAAFMMIPPPPRRDARKMMLCVVFRPIAERTKIDPPKRSAIALLREDVR